MDGLSTLIIALCAVLLTGLGTASAISKKMMSKEDCKEEQDHCGRVRHERFIASAERINAIKKSIDCLKTSNDVQYEMLKSIVTHMNNLTPDDKERILNTKGQIRYEQRSNN